MAARIAHLPSRGGLSGTARLVWQASQALLRAVRTGDRAQAERLGVWLANTREDRRCTPALARTINSGLEIALRTFGGETPAVPSSSREVA